MLTICQRTYRIRKYCRTGSTEGTRLTPGLTYVSGNAVAGAHFVRVGTRLPRNPGYSQRNTFVESAVQTRNTTINAATSPTCANHASPLQIPSSSDTA